MRPLAARRALPALALPVVLLAAGADAEAQAPERYTLRGREVAVYDLAGRVDVVQGDGSDVTVEVVRRGRDAGRVRVERGEVDGRDALRIGLPDEHIVYPELGRDRVQSRIGRDGRFGGSTNGGWLTGRTVDIRRDGDGREGWADVTVRVPRGQHVQIHVLAGVAAARGVDGVILLDGHAARVVAERTRGTLTVDAGSGGAEVRDVEGELRLDSGSGDVRLERVRASRLHLDAGSGSVRGADVQAPELSLDTGSGALRLERVATRSLRLDSGSGAIDLGLTSDVDDVRIDSGSGSVTLRLPTSLGATLDVETGSGGIDSELPITVTTSERGRLRGTLGDGQGRIAIDAGSGRVRLLRN